MIAFLFDFGGVLTSSVEESFAGFSEAATGDRGLVLELLATDIESARLLVDHEDGRLDDTGFERGFAARLSAAGTTVSQDGLIAGL